MSELAIVGAGLAGSLAAIRMAQLGHTVTVFDKRPDLRRDDVDAGRSINLALSTRGLHALETVGLREAVLSDAVVMSGRLIHDREGSVTRQPYGTQPQHVLHSVQRDRLNSVLLNAVDAAGATIRFNQRVRDFSLRTGELTIGSGVDLHQHRTDIVFGADGVFSAIRGRLQRVGRFDYSQDFLAHGYKELTIPPVDGDFAFDPDALHIWPRGGHMMIALPNADSSFTCTLFWPYSGETSFEAIGPNEIETVMRREFGDAAVKMPGLVEDFRDNPTSSLVTIRAHPWHFEDRALIIGDAAHGVVPFYGQGANAALEDVTLLMDLYARHGPDAHRSVFAEFSSMRKPHTDALALLAEEHYVEMRDSVRSPLFLFEKTVERVAERIAPNRYQSLYTLVSFTHTPYADAVRMARRQRRVALGVVAGVVALIAAIVLMLAL